MSLSVHALRREFEIRTWSKIIKDNPYVAVVQMTGGRAWGRTNMKHRILKERRDSPHVNTRFAIPRAAREGSLRTPYVGLSELFRGGPCAVVYGDDIDDVVCVIKSATKQIDGGVLIGGKFGDGIVTARTWETVLSSEGERAEWAKLIAVLGAKPSLLNVLESPHRGLLNTLKSSNGSKLVRVLGSIETSNSTT
ncbi:hypothetical protein FGB62_14g040 [Gracilaria domingensis]|nr:hypothetical protein FGB62_14g040 [Gracilaria domingensis]